MHTLSIKRVYDEPSAADGVRILVDRLWPGGESKEKAHIDLWLKEVAPSTNLRKWFNHEPAKFEEFSKKYSEELKNNNSVNQIIDILKRKNVSLIYAAKDEQINQAVVLRNFILKKLH